MLIKFIIFFSLLAPSFSSAQSYDSDVLDIFSKIIPRFILMSTSQNKIEDNLHICIISDNIDNMTAISLVDKINSNYPNGIKEYKINLKTTNYDNIAECQNSQLSFLFNSSNSNIKNVLDFSNKNSTLTVSYDPEMLEHGVALSLHIGRKITPYINLKAIQDNGQNVNNMLLRVSKIYYAGENR